MKKFTFAVMLSLAFTTVACDKSQPADAPTEATPAAEQGGAEAAAPEGAPAAAAGETITATLEGDVAVVNLGSTDQMTYTAKVIKVPAGKKVKLTLKHEGQLAKEVMGHNFILLKKGVDANAFAAAASAAKDTDYIAEGQEEEIIAHTEMIGGGASTTIEFDAPEAGTYRFMCSFPGHFAMMQGDFIVE